MLFLQTFPHVALQVTDAEVLSVIQMMAKQQRRCTVHVLV
jgi:hypothetical protein